ncbi:MAG: helix-turn-helix domain-containing protein [Nanoarchaeota archaeon]
MRAMISEEMTVLEELGLSKRESAAYLALLESGLCTVGSITKKTGIPSSKIYEVLDRLIMKGLVTAIIMKDQKHFQAADPETVLQYFNQRQERYEKILPRLKEKQRFSKDKQEVEIYEGNQAIFRMIIQLVEQAKRGDEYLSFSLGEEHGDPDISRFLSNLAWRRIEKGLDIKVISSIKARKTIESAYPRIMLKKLHNRYTSFHFPQGMIVLNDYLIILEWPQRSTAIRIKSRNMAEKYRKFFYDIYEKAQI